ncbi:MAG: TetR/AcrR family transcriptional regulator [Actinomycetota bacterium]|nr:TetR/AcrR family transcriptional regulator [Actinomycetota bacterium]
MPARDGDLTPYARIRDAALEGFARDGVAATSIRGVAAAAGVSPGLVQHHFATKAALRRAVDEHVLAVVAEGLAGVGRDSAAGDPVEEVGDRITAVVREHHLALLYVARSVADGDPGGLDMFDGLVAVADAQIARLAEEDLLAPGVDRTWAALHGVVLNLATVLMSRAVSRHLPEDFLEPAQLERWNQATTALFRRGFYHPE